MKEKKKGLVTNFCLLQVGDKFRIFTEEGCSNEVYIKLECSVSEQGLANALCIKDSTLIVVPNMDSILVEQEPRYEDSRLLEAVLQE